jgi:hypothetical protein
LNSTGRFKVETSVDDIVVDYLSQTTNDIRIQDLDAIHSIVTPEVIIFFQEKIPNFKF